MPHVPEIGAGGLCHADSVARVGAVSGAEHGMLRPRLVLHALAALEAAADDRLEPLQRLWSALEPDLQFGKLIRRFDPCCGDVVTIGTKLVRR